MVVSSPPGKRCSIRSSTRVDSASRLSNAPLSSEASTCSFDWNGNATRAATTQAAITTHLERRPVASRAMAPIRAAVWRSSRQRRRRAAADRACGARRQPIQTPAPYARSSASLSGCGIGQRRRGEQRAAGRTRAASRSGAARRRRPDRRAACRARRPRRRSSAAVRGRAGAIAGGRDRERRLRMLGGERDPRRRRPRRDVERARVAGVALGQRRGGAAVVDAPGEPVLGVRAVRVRDRARGLVADVGRAPDEVDVLAAAQRRVEAQVPADHERRAGHERHAPVRDHARGLRAAVERRVARPRSGRGSASSSSATIRGAIASSSGIGEVRQQRVEPACRAGCSRSRAARRGRGWRPRARRCGRRPRRRGSRAGCTARPRAPPRRGSGAAARRRRRPRSPRRRRGRRAGRRSGGRGPGSRR